MGTKLKRAILVLVSLVIMSACFFVGYSIGCNDRLIIDLTHHSATTASSLVLALNELRDGDQDTAISDLESQLDGNIVMHGFGLKMGKPIIKRSVHTDADIAMLMRIVVRYRNKYPPIDDDPAFSRVIYEILEPYRPYKLQIR